MKKPMYLGSLVLAVGLLSACGVSKFESSVKQGSIKLPEPVESQDQKPQQSIDQKPQEVVNYNSKAPETVALPPPPAKVEADPLAMAGESDYSADPAPQPVADPVPQPSPEPDSYPAPQPSPDPVSYPAPTPEYEEPEDEVVVIPSPEETEPEIPELPEEVPIELPEVERPDDVDGGSVIHRPPNDDDDRAISSCSAAFGRSLPLGGNGEVRTITANISILGGGNLRDNRSTARPELTIIYANIGILSNLKWELLNPNGIYCIIANINILSKLSIYLEERAQLSDGRVAINILSSSNASTATVGVNILSNVKVYRIRRN